MGKRRKVLSPDHARALIKEAIGKIHGDPDIEAEAAAEIAAIEAGHATKQPRPKPRPDPSRAARRRAV